jgi:uncharacterized protein YecE (DUF72 family)
MFGHYVRHFSMVELNFTFYSMPGQRTFESLLARSPEGFEFWVKVNKAITHERDLSQADAFLAATEPLAAARKLAGLILQFPQSFHRTVASRKFLAAALDKFPSAPVAVEFRDRSWEHASTYDGLRSRGVTLVVPDAPPISGLFHPPPMATSPIAYLRLHSRNAANWYKGEADRYDYDYSERELREIADAWAPVEAQAAKVYTMFNNCHRGQAAKNAEAFRRILGQIK